jgi:hypothetical protein
MDARCRCPASHDGLGHGDMSSTGVDLEKLPDKENTDGHRRKRWLVAACSRHPGAHHHGSPSLPLAVERTAAATDSTSCIPRQLPSGRIQAHCIPSRPNQQRESTYGRGIGWEWRGLRRERHGLAAAVPWLAPAKAAVVPEAESTGLDGGVRSGPRAPVCSSTW